MNLTTTDQAIIAAQYMTGDPAIPTPAETKAFRGWLADSFRCIAHSVVTTPAEVSPETFLATWQVTGKLLISAANSEHPFWDLETNVRFRAVHDFHHLMTAGGFGWDGEVATYNYAKTTAPAMIHWILRSEILGQAAAALRTGAFQEQKLVREISA
jgi:hypothetical protein